MSSTNTGIETATTTTHGGDATNTSKASKKRLRVSSEAHKRPARNLIQATNDKLTLKSAPANAPIIKGVIAAAAARSRACQGTALK